MSLLDYLLACIIVGSVASGFWTGLARAGVGFIASIAAVFLAFRLYDVPGAWIQSFTEVPAALASVMGFMVVIVAVSLVGSLIGGFLSKMFQWTGLSFLDRISGAVFGLVRGLLVVIAFVGILMTFTPRPVPNWMTGSHALPYALDASNVAVAIAPDALTDAITMGFQDFKNAWLEEMEKARQRGSAAMRGE